MARTANGNEMLRSDQPNRQQNIRKIVSVYEKGCTPAKGRVGIELEHFVVHDDTDLPLTYSEPHGMKWMLEQLRHDYPTASFGEDDNLIGLTRKENGIVESITLEPAAQIEYSVGPFDTLQGALDCFSEFEAKLEGLCAQANAHIARIGYQPAVHVEDTELIPKTRYRYMDRYLGGKSVWGRRMMRGTTSTQVSIDYQSVPDLLHKMRLANAMVPMLSLICDNSPLFEGGESPHRLMRTEIWENLDPGRTGTAPDVMSPAYTLEDMAAHVLDTPAIVVPTDTGEVYDTRTFGEVYANKTMTDDEAFHAISMLFNDIRLKSYLEIRPADAMGIPQVIAYAALLKGMFADDHTLTRLDSVFGDVTNEDIDDAKTALESNGYEATVYGRPVAEITDDMFDIAHEGLSESEERFLEPLESIERKRLSPADVWRQKNENVRNAAE